MSKYFFQKRYTSKFTTIKFTPWKTLISEEILSTPWMSIYHDLFELPNGKKNNYYYVHTLGSSLIIPVKDDGKVILIKQYRYLFNDISIEIPCGGIKEGQNEELAARAELIEETGFDCKKLKKIGQFIPYNGVSDETCHVYVASGLFHVGAKPDETEQIEVFEASPEDIDRMIEKGKINDGMSIAGWTIGKKYVLKKCGKN